MKVVTGNLGDVFSIELSSDSEELYNEAYKYIYEASHRAAMDCLLYFDPDNARSGADEIANEYAEVSADNFLNAILCADNR